MEREYKNELVNAWLERNYQTFAGTVDTCDFVPKSYHRWILRFIFKIMKKQGKQLHRDFRRTERARRRQARMDLRQGGAEQNLNLNNPVEETD